MSDPAIVGRYKVVSRLGQGAMGALFLAHDPIIDRMVAIKVMREGADNPELRERFAREARAAGRLRHPNIVTIFDVGEEGGHPFIAMEYVPGDTLKAIIHRPARLPLTRKLKLIEELCDGLGYAHKSGLVHRDIKPANLMVDSDGVLKILDFGIVRMASSGMTQAGMLVGTLPYMSPEQIAGRPIDHRSDIFAVGDVAYELISHKQAFPGGLDDGIMGRVLNSPPQPLEQLCPGLDHEIIAVVSKALEKDPANRYQDLTKMRRDLARIRDRLEKDEEADIAPTQQFSARTIASGRKPADSGSSSGGGTKSPARREMEQRRHARIKESLEAAERALETGNFESAISAAEEAALLDPANERAMEIVERAHGAIDDRQVGQWLDEARELLNRGEPTSAANLVDRARALRPSSHDVSAVQRTVDEVRRELEIARERAHLVHEATARARTELAAGAWGSAIRAADEALARQADHAEALQIRKQAADALEAQEKREAFERAAADAIEAARRGFAAGRHDQAIAGLERFQPAHPAVSEALEGMRREAAEIARRRDEEVRAALRRKIAALMAAAQQAADADRFDEASGLLDRARELDTQAPGLDALRRTVADRKAAAEKAARIRETVEQKLADAATALENDDLRSAARLLEEARKLDPANGWVGAFTDTFRQKIAAKVAGARDAADAGRYDEAIAVLEGVRPHEPPAGPSHALLNEVLERKAAADEAARRRALAAQKVGEAAAARQRREMARAARLCDEALKLDPGNAEAPVLAAEIQSVREAARVHLTASQKAIGNREFRAALEEIDRARAIDPDASGIGMLAERAGAGLGEIEREERRQQEIRTALASAVGRLEAADPAAAMTFVEEALRLDAGNADARALRDRIKHALEIRAEEERREAERQKREAAIAKAMRKAAKTRSHEAALRTLRDTLPLDPQHDELRAAIAEREAAREAEKRKSGVVPLPDVPSDRAAPGRTKWIAAAAGIVLVIVAAVVLWPGAGEDVGTSDQIDASRQAEPPAPGRPAGSDRPPPPAQPEDTSVPPPPPDTAATGDSSATDPPAPTADPAAAEKQLETLRQLARLQFARREYRDALATAEGGLKIRRDDAGLRSVMVSMMDQASRDTVSAREEATRAEAGRLAASTYGEGQKREREAQAHRGAGRQPAAIRSLWAARDAFAKAAGEAKEAAEREAEQRRAEEAAAAEAKAKADAASRTAPPAAPPTRSDPPPTTTPPKPETKPAPEPVKPETAPTRPGSPVDERQNVERSIRRYEAAYRALDLNALRNVWAMTPSVSRGLQESFARMESYDIDVTIKDIKIEGSKATVVAVNRVRARTKGVAAGTQTATSGVVFTLERRGSGWIITDVAAR